MGQYVTFSIENDKCENCETVTSNWCHIRCNEKKSRENVCILFLTVAFRKVCIYVRKLTLKFTMHSKVKNGE